MIPKINHPTFEINIPSIGKPCKVRPMLVKEEKILLMAKEGESRREIMNAIKQVVNNCIVSGDIETNNLTIFDIEYLFLKIRAFSVNNIIAFSIKEEDEEFKFEIDLDKVEMKMPKKKQSNIIEINKDVSLQLQYPLANIYDDSAFASNNESEMMDALMAGCIVKIVNSDDTIHDFSNLPKKDKIDFIDNNIDSKTYGKIKDYLDDIPTLYHEIKYTPAGGSEKKLELTSIFDFFTF